jgi:hypothetical protein
MFPRLLLCAIGAALCGCSIHPIPDDVTRISTAQIVYKIRCEARAAVLKHLGKRDEYANGGIGYDFSFTMTENNNIGAGASLEFPFISKFGGFSTDLAAGRDKKRETERKFIVVETFEELERHGQRKGRENACPKNDRENWMYPIAGRIGLDEVVATFFALDTGGTDLRSFSDQVSFTTTIGGSIKPRVELNPLAGQLRVTDVSGSLAANRTDAHKVKIVLAQRVGDLDELGGGKKGGRGAEVRDMLYQSLDKARPQEFKLVQ